MDDLAAFKAELHNLLAKYGAKIHAEVGEGSDTHGIYDESIGVSFGQRDGWKVHELCEGWSLTENTLG
jgi:hypothetical protein